MREKAFRKEVPNPEITISIPYSLDKKGHVMIDYEFMEEQFIDEMHKLEKKIEVK